MDYYRKIQGDRLYLSPMNIEDAPKYTTWINQLHTSLPLGNAHRQFSLQAEKDFIASVASDHHYSIINAETNELLGNCSILNIHPIHKRATVGIFIGDIKNRGLGYGTEALQLLCEYGFSVLNLNNINLQVLAFNQRGIQSYEKVGFKTYNIFHESKKFFGKFYDMYHMEILAKDFTYKYLDHELLDIINKGGQ